jgi:O-antigen/teichoic acid export membrane protein
MRAHLSNAAYGVLDYAAYPVAMLAAAPTLLHHLGAASYGVWVICTAVVSTGGIIAAGFGDANIQHVAGSRGHNDHNAVQHAVRSMVGINLLLGCTLASISFALAPVLAQHVARDGNLYATAVWSLRIASALMLVRALESVCMSTQRAFERYGEAVRISLAVRVLTVALAAVLASRGFGVIAIMVLTFVLTTLGTILQFIPLRRDLRIASLWPAFDRNVTSALFAFGAFSWLQAVSSVLFSQADRLILGASLGTVAVTSYSLCVQMAQPIYGIASTGLHFLFPYLSGRRAAAQPALLRKAIATAFIANLLFVAAATAAVLLLGPALLRAWVGADIARSSATVLAPIVWSFALLGLNVSAYYALLALGRVRAVTLLNLFGGVAMLLSMAWLLPREGIRGVAIARILYGLITLAMYFPLVRMLRQPRRIAQSAPGARPVCEEA